MHPELLKATVQACRDQIAGGDRRGPVDGIPAERLMFAVAQLADEVDRLRASGVDVPARGNTTCNPHPDAPHGFNRNASHNAGRYVCDCEGWMPPAGVTASDGSKR